MAVARFGFMARFGHRAMSGWVRNAPDGRDGEPQDGADQTAGWTAAPEERRLGRVSMSTEAAFRAAWRKPGIEIRFLQGFDFDGRTHSSQRCLS